MVFAYANCWFSHAVAHILEDGWLATDMLLCHNINDMVKHNTAQLSKILKENLNQAPGSPNSI